MISDENACMSSVPSYIRSTTAGEQAKIKIEMGMTSRDDTKSPQCPSWLLHSHIVIHNPYDPLPWYRDEPRAWAITN